MARNSKRWWSALTHEAIHQEKGVYDLPKIKIESAERAAMVRPENMLRRNEMFKYEHPTLAEILELDPEQAEKDLEVMSSKMQTYHDKKICMGSIKCRNTKNPYQSERLRTLLYRMAYNESCYSRAPKAPVNFIHDIYYTEEDSYLVCKLNPDIKYIKPGVYEEVIVNRFNDGCVMLLLPTSKPSQGMFTDALTIVANTLGIKNIARAWEYFQITKSKPLEHLYILNWLYSPYQGSSLYMYDINPSLVQLHKYVNSNYQLSENKASNDMNLLNNLMKPRRQ